MHAFPELIDRCAAFALNALKDAQANTIEALQTSAATPLVKTLQMVQLQKVVSAVGMFSIFDAMLQDRLRCADGFKEVAEILYSQGALELAERLSHLRLAINVLKHGEGRSYEDLLAKVAALPFRLKRPGDNFFSEGDVSEVSTLIDVDDAFIMHCARTIREVSEAIQKVRPDFIA
jgi:hypothetical protein